MLVRKPSVAVLGPLLGLVLSVYVAADEPPKAPVHPMLGGNPQRTGYTELLGPMGEPEVLWEAAPKDKGGICWTQPIVDEAGNIYVDVGRDRGADRWSEKLISYDVRGRERWRYDSEDPRTTNALSVPALTPAGGVVVCFRNGGFHGVTRDEGKAAWTAALRRGVVNSVGSPVVDKRGDVYMCGRKGLGLCKMDCREGETQWEFELSRGNGTSPALSLDQETIYMGRNNGAPQLYAIRAEDGTLKWRFMPPVLDDSKFGWCSPMVGPDGTIYFQLERSNSLYAVGDQGESAALKWRFLTGRYGDAPRLGAVDRDTVYVGTCGPNPILLAVNFDGTEKWRYEFSEGGLLTNPIVNRQAVYVGVNESGLVCAFDRQDGSLLWSKQVAAPGGYLGEALTLGEDRVLYAVTNGTVAHPGHQAVLVALKFGLPKQN